MERPNKNLVDYLVIAIAPALIMLLVGSLIYFLIDVFYDGQYVARLKLVAALFVFAAVLIGRIAAEDGSEYARLYALPLAAATFLALWRFVDAGMILNLVLIGVTWWCAHQLTLDCTMVDDRKRASGEGLLQTLGLDGQPNTELPEPNHDNLARGVADNAATVGNPADEDERSLSQRIRDWFRHRKKHHAPGLTIVYFAAASLPLFGLGQIVTDADHRWSAFRQLFVYVASALALLMATSFLQLRRYLRQRRIDMPLEMTATWLSVGTAMIVSIMLLALFLPRPEPGESVAGIAKSVGSKVVERASKFAFGNEGPEQNDGKLVKTDDDSELQKDGGSASNEPGGSSQNGKSDDGAKSESQRDGESSGDQSESNENRGSESDSKSNSDSGSTSDSESESISESESDSESRSNSDRTNEPAPSNSQNEQRQSDQNRNRNQDLKQESDQNRSGSGRNRESQSDDESAKARELPDRAPPSPSAPSPSAPSPPMFPNLFANIPRLFYWLIIGLVLAFLGWKFRSVIAAAVLQFVRDMQRLFASFFKRDDENAADNEIEEEPKKVFASFASFRNPFAKGDARQRSFADLIRYSFEALEAWARDHQCPRLAEQTPAEFARSLGRRHQALANSAQQLASLYSQLAYSNQNPPASPQERTRQSLEQLWTVLSST